MTVDISMYEVTGIAVLLLLLGSFIKDKSPLLRKYAIPSPVIGGLLFSCLVLIFRSTGTIYFHLDDTLQELFMLLFFTSIGFNVNLRMLQKGGKSVLVFLGLATVLCLLQNVVAVALAKPVNVHPQLALMTGSIALTGGLGTSAAIAPMVEANGVMGAKAIAIASATFGMVIGSLMGAPHWK